VRFHDLRHSHATQLLLAGVHPKIAQERLGHATITTTLDLVLARYRDDAERRGREGRRAFPSCYNALWGHKMIGLGSKLGSNGLLR